MRPFVRGYQEAIAAMREGVDPDLVLGAVEHFKPDDAVAAFPWDHLIEYLFDAEGALLAHYLAGATSIAYDPEYKKYKKLYSDKAAPKAEIILEFDQTNPFVDGWIKAKTGELVVSIDATTRAAIREIVFASFFEQIAPRTVARMIEQVIGMTPRQARTLLAFTVSLIEDGYDRDEVDQFVARRAALIIRRRAELIARTELMFAANAGRLEGWRQAYGSGFVGVGTEKEWLTTADDMTCEMCQDMKGQRVPWDGWFSLGIEMPPAHPACRCTAILVVPEVPVDFVRVA